MSNRAELTGEAVSEPVFSHGSFGESFYSFKVKVPRLSDSVDYINIIASERLLKECDYKIGDKLFIRGQFRSYNNYTGVGSKLVLTLFAKTIHMSPPEADYTNEVELNGYICKAPTYRTTPFGREITDVLLAVNRNHNKSDYIPCIAWGRNARFVKNLAVGEKVALSGRIQSREYTKKINETESKIMTAYEVSISRLAAYDNVETFDLLCDFENKGVDVEPRRIIV